MQAVSDAFLFTIAEVSATLIGLFVVGVFFYIDKGLRRLHDIPDVVAPYIRAGTRIVLVLYAIPLGPRSPLSSWSRSGPGCCSYC
jgi:hypothetical protein